MRMCVNVWMCVHVVCECGVWMRVNVCADVCANVCEYVYVRE